jgi:hypothetical protein
MSEPAAARLSRMINGQSGRAAWEACLQGTGMLQSKPGRASRPRGDPAASVASGRGRKEPAKDENTIRNHGLGGGIFDGFSYAVTLEGKMFLHSCYLCLYPFDIAVEIRGRK